MKKNAKADLNRRTFMKAAAGFGGASLFGGLPFKAFAQASLKAPDRMFVFAYFGGGWDVLLSLDPRDPAVFTDERLAETRIRPGYNILNAQDASYSPTPIIGSGNAISFGPAIGEMAKHSDLCAVIRGINMNTVAHEVGYRYFITGREPNGSSARGSSTATEIVGQMMPKVPVGSIAYGVESYNDRYPGAANALRVSSSADLLLTLAPSTTLLDSEIEQQLVNMRGKKVSCEADLYDTRGLVTQYRDARGQMQEVLSSGLDKAFRFNLPENDAVRAAYGLPANGPYDNARGRAALTATALKRGISQCVSINITGGLDTHFGTQLTHANNQKAGWDALGLLVGDLRNTPHPSGGSFMDRTTLMVFSEFSRTPLINASGGRDHHISNSCLIAGAGFKHNVVFGKSGDVGMSAGLVDLKTGLPSPTGTAILPDEIIATILASAKLDYSITRTQPLRSLLAG